jgi:hypothetical protein
MSVMPGMASLLYLQLRSTIPTSPVETQPQQKQDVSPMIVSVWGEAEKEGACVYGETLSLLVLVTRIERRYFCLYVRRFVGDVLWWVV